VTAARSRAASTTLRAPRRSGLCGCLGAALTAGLLLASCGSETAEAGEVARTAPGRSWPAGCVLAVDDVPILADEVDVPSAWIEMIEPHSTPPQLRRLALTNVVLPRVLAGLMQPAARERARAEAEARAAALHAGTYQGVPDKDGAFGTRLEGTWQDFGIPAWGTAVGLPKGEWSDVVEDAGAFAVLRVLAREAAPVSAATWMRIDLFRFPYLPEDTEAGDLERAYDEHRLTIVDPAWRELVPERTQYRMGVHAP